jgi:hypothetical protein
VGIMMKNQSSNWWWLDSQSSTRRSQWLQSTLAGTLTNPSFCLFPSLAFLAFFFKDILSES